MRWISSAAAIFVAWLSFLSIARGQGSLTPPGPPSATMKSLDQIASTGIAINATNTPGDSTAIYIINQPGSYYLTGNLTGVSGKKGISIQADNVTVDLNGFAVVGVTGSNIGISSFSKKNVCLQNGLVSNWGSDGINMNSSTNCLIHHIRSASNGVDGILGGLGFVIHDCVIQSNGVDGIFVTEAGTIEHCVSIQNLSRGISASFSSSIIDCTAVLNGASGLDVGTDCLIKSCTTTDNKHGVSTSSRCTIIGCGASDNNGDGFRIGDYSAVINNTASNNDADGIRVGNSCFVMTNSACANANNGIEVTGQLNRIDSNFANGNGSNGILWKNDLVIRNTCFVNGAANYFPTLASGPSSGNTAPLQAASNATSPWANF